MKTSNYLNGSNIFKTTKVFYWIQPCNNIHFHPVFEAIFVKDSRMSVNNSKVVLHALGTCLQDSNVLNLFPNAPKEMNLQISEYCLICTEKTIIMSALI